MSGNYKYDIALSFAEEELQIAKAIADALRGRNISYYLYTEHDADNLGKTLLQISQQVYGVDARHVLIVTSKIFVEKYWTVIEAQIVQAAAFMRPDFIFRVKLDETEVDGISKHLFSLKWNNNAEEIAKAVQMKIESEKKEAAVNQPGAVLSKATDMRPQDSTVTSTRFLSVKKFIKKWALLLGGLCFGIAVMISRSVIGKSDSRMPDASFGSVNVTAISPEKVFIPGGTFIMGVDGSWNMWKPAHKVQLPDFYISKTEVTVAQFRKFCNETGNPMPPAPPYSSGEGYPVVNVIWEEAAAYCRWAGGRLPTEAEWEYAASKNGQIGDRYSGGNSMDKAGYYAGNTTKAHEVGRKKKNAMGLFDMSGNVAEWCSDWLGAYPAGDQYNPQGASGGKYKVIRGGHYKSRISSDTSANELLIRYRDKEEPSSRQPFIGFRVVWDAGAR